MFDHGGNACFRDAGPNGFGTRIIVGEDFPNQAQSRLGDHNAVGAAVICEGAASDKSALFEAINHASDIRPVHDEMTAEFDLVPAVGDFGEEVEDVELRGAKVPSGEEQPAGVPQRLGGAEQLEEGLVTGAGLGCDLHLKYCLHVNCLCVNNY